jgi:hypothetical protein
MSTPDRVAKGAGRAIFSSRLVAHVNALRPKQWIKNGLVFLPLLFAINVVSVNHGFRGRE